MAKAGNVSDRGSTAWNNALITRPCPGCSNGQMEIVVREPGHKVRWRCKSCGYRFSKRRRDWNPHKEES